jgi:hypothetical protein
VTIHHLHTEVEIEASAERVWAVLSDFVSYPQWNAFIGSVGGISQQGRGFGSQSSLVAVGPCALRASSGARARASMAGPVFGSGAVRWEHSFFIEPLAEGKVRFQQSERFSGILVGLLRASLDRDAKRGFEEMNRAWTLDGVTSTLTSTGSRITTT